MVKQNYETARKIKISTPSDTEITIEAIINGPREAIFNAHLDPQAIPKWWGPSNLKTTVIKLDGKPGGEWNYKQKDENGNEFNFFGIFKEIARYSKLVWTFNMEGFQVGEIVETMLFEEIDKNRTRIKVRSIFPSVEARNGMLESDMESGYSEGLDRLENLIIQKFYSIQKIKPCLWFEGQAEEAMNYYVDIFNSAPNSKKSSRIISIERYTKDINAPGADELEGKIITGIFELEGQEYMCLDGGPMFHFDESISFYVECEGQGEVDHFWERFIEDGGEASQCGWLKDKFGISWQIIPKRLGELVSGKDRTRAMKVINAMLQMQKIVIKDLELAYQNK